MVSGSCRTLQGRDFGLSYLLSIGSSHAGSCAGVYVWIVWSFLEATGPNVSRAVYDFVL